MNSENSSKLEQSDCVFSDRPIITLDCFELETCVDIDRSSPLQDSCQDRTDLICRKVAQ